MSQLHHIIQNITTINNLITHWDDNPINEWLPSQKRNQIILEANPKVVISELIEDIRLQNFYRICREIVLPDIWNGYFVYSTEKILEDRLSEWSPRRISGGDYDGNVIRFGSSGGGDSFVVREDELILLLPSDGAIHAQIFDGGLTKVKYIADDFEQFLEKLLKDVEAFLRNRVGWKYILDY